WMTVLTNVEDPVYMSRRYITTSDFKKLPDATGWMPPPCPTNWPTPVLPDGDLAIRPSITAADDSTAGSSAGARCRARRFVLRTARGYQVSSLRARPWGPRRRSTIHPEGG